MPTGSSASADRAMDAVSCAKILGMSTARMEEDHTVTTFNILKQFGIWVPSWCNHRNGRAFFFISRD
jgi:hypothetical protein